MNGVAGGINFWNPFVDKITGYITNDHERLKRAKTLKDHYEQLIEIGRTGNFCSGCMHYFPPVLQPPDHDDFISSECGVCNERFCQRFEQCMLRKCPICSDLHCMLDQVQCKSCGTKVCVDCMENGTTCVRCGTPEVADQPDSDEESASSSSSESVHEEEEEDENGEQPHNDESESSTSSSSASYSVHSDSDPGSPSYSNLE